MKRKLTLVLLVLLSLTTHANDNNSQTLKTVMQGLSESMNKLNQGIFYEDFKVVEKAALEISNHPKPKSQLPIVLKTLNIRMMKFKGFDSKVHDSAREIAKLAKKKDLAGILIKHKVIMDNCVSCHTQFRSELSQAFSKE